ncbi:hypothetical protein QBC47DRAFT_453576 [Echria macrotheca]|uniref:Uncharacterized protein n=1 Tax=Echria macrotheca TaxID=438768 RepID=A0AAJ0B708_9PEZI|nr:hypothetical protein QBC47DRAFT_453576 [Echria macrotheca]
MSGRYERVNAHDDDDVSPTVAVPRQTQPIPNSPPPSFHSRASSILSRERDTRVNPDLADAFDTDGDESDDDADDRQRLVRGNSSTTIGGTTPSDSASRSAATQRTQTPATTGSSAPAQGSARIYGGGIQSDGVFSNLTAKPERAGEEKEEQPPTYEQAAADAAPPYWETTILAPGLGGPDEVYIDGMPVGSFFSFVWNGMISFSFQLVGFLLTYLLHSTHAAKNGSRAGLGITMIQYGFYLKGSPGSGSGSGGMGGSNVDADGYATPQDPNSHNFDQNNVDGGDGSSGGISDLTGGDWAAYILMIVGWFILIMSVNDYLKARRHEQLVLQSPDRGLPVPIIAVGERSRGTLATKRISLRAVSSASFLSHHRKTHRYSINMAWRSSGASNRDLIENLWRNDLIKNPQVKEAFLKVDRAHYAPSSPYEDSPQPIGHEATISAPHMHATAVEHLLPYLVPSESRPAPRVLDIGSGSGYLTHVMAELVGPDGVVVGVEHIAALRELGEKNMSKSPEGRELLESKRVRFRVGDGRKGWVEEGEEGKKWDAIHVGASAKEVHPAMLAQLGSPGRMFIPVDDDSGGWSQHVWCVDKDGEGKVSRKKLFGVRYVPLTDAPTS